MAATDLIKDYIIENFLFGDGEHLSEDTSFIREGIIDSIGMMELVDFIENEYQIKIADNELIPQNLDSLNKLNIFIQSKRRSN